MSVAPVLHHGEVLMNITFFAGFDDAVKLHRACRAADTKGNEVMQQVSRWTVLEAAYQGGIREEVGDMGTATLRRNSHTGGTNPFYPTLALSTGVALVLRRMARTWPSSGSSCDAVAAAAVLL